MTKFDPNKVRISRHAAQRVADRGFSENAVWDAVYDPEITYAANSERYGDQLRLIKGEIVVVLSLATMVIPTVFFHGRTDYRP